MQSRTGIRAQIEPLTHPGDDGKTFKRSSQVEAQIVEALSLEPSRLIGRVALEDYQQSGYLKEECVVYLIRKLQRDGEFDLAGQFMNYLAIRIAKRVHRQLSKFLHRTLVDQCFRDVISEVTCRVIDLSSDADDFAQVRFGRWLEWLNFKIMRPYFRCQDRARKAASDGEEAQDRKGQKRVLVDTGPLPDQLLN